MDMKLLVSSITLASLLTIPTAYSGPGESTHTTSTTNQPSGQLLADLVRGDIALDRERAVIHAPIYSHADLESYLNNPSNANSVLFRLSPHGLDKFLQSLVFNENGLVGFNFSSLKEELSIAEAYEVLRLFGAQRTISFMSDATPVSLADHAIQQSIVRPLLCDPTAPTQDECLPGDDYLGFKCVSRANCKQTDFTDICMNGC